MTRTHLAIIMLPILYLATAWVSWDIFWIINAGEWPTLHRIMTGVLNVVVYLFTVWTFPVDCVYPPKPDSTPEGE